MGFQREAEHAIHIDMTPIVDAMFTLILFLVVTSSYVESMEQDLNIALPSMSQKLKVQKPTARPIVVNVRFLPGGDAFYHVENERMSVPALSIHLKRAQLRDKDQAVVIRGDRNVKWDHVARVMTECARVGITKVSATVEIDT